MIRQGISRPTNESPKTGPNTERANGRAYVWIDASTIQPINQGTNGPVEGPFIEAPNGRINDGVGERNSRRWKIQYKILKRNTSQYNIYITIEYNVRI